MNEVIIERAHGNKCARCWKYSIEVGRLFKYPDLCYRCMDIMDMLQSEAIEMNTNSGDWKDDPIAFYDRWLKDLEIHPIKTLALDSQIPKLMSSDGKTILEIWGNEEQMPWIKNE